MWQNWSSFHWCSFLKRVRCLLHTVSYLWIISFAYVISQIHRCCFCLWRVLIRLLLNRFKVTILFMARFSLWYIHVVWYCKIQLLIAAPLNTKIIVVLEEVFIAIPISQEDNEQLLSWKLLASEAHCY